MPSPYLTYALAALSLGFGVAFMRVSDENSELARAKMVIEMKLETAQQDAKAFREKYASESKAREFAEAAQTLAETSERATRAQLAHEAKVREAAEKTASDAETARQSAEAALADAREQVRQLNEKLLEASAAKQQSEAKTEAQSADKRDAAAVEVKEPTTTADASHAVATEAMAAQASMGGSSKRSWFFGLF